MEKKGSISNKGITARLVIHTVLEDVDDLHYDNDYLRRLNPES